MDRADDRGVHATTRVQPAPRVTLDWRATPFTCRGKEEAKWRREKNGRRVLRTLNGHGKTIYWRAPRPRPRLHRRQRRRIKQEVMDAAIDRNESPPMSLLEAHTGIQVLQDAVRASVARELELRKKLQDTEDALVQSQAKVGRQAAKLDRLALKHTGDVLLQRNEDVEPEFVGVAGNEGKWATHTAEAVGALQDRMGGETVAATTGASATATKGVPRKEMNVACLLSGAPVNCPYKLKPEDKQMEQGGWMFDHLLVECQDSFPTIDVKRGHEWIDGAEHTAIAHNKPMPEWTPSARRAVNKLHAQQITTWRIRLLCLLIVGYLVWLLK